MHEQNLTIYSPKLKSMFPIVKLCDAYFITVDECLHFFRFCSVLEKTEEHQYTWIKVSNFVIHVFIVDEYLHWSGFCFLYLFFFPCVVQLDILCENKSITGCPVNFRVIADRSQVAYHPPDRCCVGANSELKVLLWELDLPTLTRLSKWPFGHLLNPW